MWPLRRTKPRHGRGAALRGAADEAAASLAQARADHARERTALGRDRRLIVSLRDLRDANHFTATITAAFRGEP